MSTTHTQQVLALASQLQALGIARVALSRLVASGQLERAGAQGSDSI